MAFIHIFNCLVGIISPQAIIIFRLELRLFKAFEFAKYTKTLGTQRIVVILLMRKYSSALRGKAKIDLGKI